MTEFHDVLTEVHGVIWEGGTSARPELEDALVDLWQTPLPAGVVRLPTSAMQAGPHLAAQDEDGSEWSPAVVWLEPERRARIRARRMAAF